MNLIELLVGMVSISEPKWGWYSKSMARLTESTIELTRNNLHTDDPKIEICQFLDDVKNNMSKLLL